jgi:hypothetical protein
MSRYTAPRHRDEPTHAKGMKGNENRAFTATSNGRIVGALARLVRRMVLPVTVLVGRCVDGRLARARSIGVPR